MLWDASSFQDVLRKLINLPLLKLVKSVGQKTVGFLIGCSAKGI